MTGHEKFQFDKMMNDLGDTINGATLNLVDLTLGRTQQSKESKSVSDSDKPESAYERLLGQKSQPGYDPVYNQPVPARAPEETLEGLFKLDRTNNGKLSLPELTFEVGKMDQEFNSRFRSNYNLYGYGRKPTPEPEYNAGELRRAKDNFAQIAGPDGQMSREEFLEYRRDWEALPRDFKHADSNADLKLSREEIKELAEDPTWSRDFATYNRYVHLNRNFDAAAGRDRKLTGAEWNQYLKVHPVGD